MKGRIFDLKKFAIHDGPGIRTTVFFSGCPLRCWWCQNPESLLQDTGARPAGFSSRMSAPWLPDPEKVVGEEVSVGALMKEIMKDNVFYLHSGGGVTVSGGEPLLQSGFLLGLLSACRSEGLHVALDTSGYAEREDIEKIIDLVDLYLYDIKFIDEKEHEKYTGVSNRLILENLEFLSRKGKDIEIRLPLVPGITDTAGNIDSIIDYLKSSVTVRKVELLAYNKMCEDKFKRMRIEYIPGPLPPISDEDISILLKRFSDEGFTVNAGGRES